MEYKDIFCESPFYVYIFMTCCRKSIFWVRILCRISKPLYYQQVVCTHLLLKQIYWSIYWSGPKDVAQEGVNSVIKCWFILFIIFILRWMLICFSLIFMWKTYLTFWRGCEIFLPLKTHFVNLQSVMGCSDFDRKSFSPFPGQPRITTMS